MGEVIFLSTSKLEDILIKRELSVTLDNIFQNSKASSGGQRDVDFVKYLIDNKLLILAERCLKRTNIGFSEEYYLERYKKVRYESDRHFLCKAMIQDELLKQGIATISDVDMGNMDVLRMSSLYDIVTDDFSTVIDIGLTPARNYFKCLTDLRVKRYLLTTYFDDYMDDVIFASFERGDDLAFINAVRDYQQIYAPSPRREDMEKLHDSGVYSGIDSYAAYDDPSTGRVYP